MGKCVAHLKNMKKKTKAVRSDEITIEECKALNEETLELFLRMDLDIISRPLESAIVFRSLYKLFHRL